MRIGISTYTYTWAFGVPGHEPSKPMTVFNLIDKAVQFNLNCVQIADNCPLEKLSEKKLEELITYSGKRKVEIEVGTRGLKKENIFTYLHIAQQLHSEILRVVIDTKDYEPPVDQIIQEIKKILPELKRLNIKLAIENHDRLKSKEFEQIVVKTDPEWVGICLDSVNSMGAGEGFETVSDILIPFTINLHVKDFTIIIVSHKIGLLIEGRPAGKGMLNIPQLLRKLSEKGGCQSAIIELWTPPELTLEETIIKEEKWASESIVYLKSFINKA